MKSLKIVIIRITIISYRIKNYIILIILIDQNSHSLQLFPNYYHFRVSLIISKFYYIFEWDNFFSDINSALNNNGKLEFISERIS
jgi:hypothetical protein